MIGTDLLNRPCTIYRVSESTRDTHGNASLVADGGTDTVCDVQAWRRKSFEQEDRTVLVEEATVYLPASATIAAGDYIVLAGDDPLPAARYDMAGTPELRYNPRTGAASHYEASARRVL